MQEDRGSLQHCYHAVPESENAQQISVRGKEGRREGGSRMTLPDQIVLEPGAG